jgi:hypothetical protein
LGKRFGTSQIETANGKSCRGSLNKPYLVQEPTSRFAIVRQWLYGAVSVPSDHSTATAPSHC